ncbi:MAG: aminoacetone oxidase family FAD-binding enzyme [Oscillospiraceae bacterium]|jgi:predicted Rossmann fold flavoprotein|nr:aminoacetone oxidase family FAD-binding enzyme [Oscillospiraceae bacterium]
MERMESFDLVIIGAGASGLTAAITAGQLAPGHRILLLERMPRAGKKILATGNGRCNLSNRAVLAHDYHNRAFALPALEAFPPAACEAFFRSLGLVTVTDGEGRLYPRSLAAASVLDALRFGLERSGADLRCDSPVFTLERGKGDFCVNGILLARRVILAAGGCAAPAQGSDGSGFALLRALGHTVVPPRPSLVQLVSGSPLPPQCKGLRVRGTVSLERTDGTLLRAAQGEILFTEDGLSGIAAMEVSRAYEDGATAVLDLAADCGLSALCVLLGELWSACPGASAEQLLAGLLPKRVGTALLRAGGWNPGNALPAAGIPALAALLKRLPLCLTGTRGFTHAQSTAGGARTEEFDPASMESRLVPGLFACGEVLDVDGGCGGFSLHWAWASGRLAGKIAGKSL